MESLPTGDTYVQWLCAPFHEKKHASLALRIQRARGHDHHNCLRAITEHMYHQWRVYPLVIHMFSMVFRVRLLSVTTYGRVSASTRTSMNLLRKNAKTTEHLYHSWGIYPLVIHMFSGFCCTSLFRFTKVGLHRPSNIPAVRGRR